jgi:hypothetical protein
MKDGGREALRCPQMAGNVMKNGDLTPKQEAAALALAAGKSPQEAAAECGCAERTIRRWLAELPQMQQRKTQLQAEMVGRTLGRMTDGMACAADTLRELLDAEKDSVRLGACRALLELTVRLKESVELEARVAALEQDHKGRAGPLASRGG